MTKRRLRFDGENGYPESETGPITEAEIAQLARRKALEPEDAGRRVKGPPEFKKGSAPDVERSVGLD